MNIKRSLAIIGLFLLATYTYSIQQYSWIRHFGSTGEDVGYTILESDSSIYVAGWFQHTVTFGTVQLTSMGDDDIYLLRMTYSGDVLWAKRFGGPFEDNVVGMVTDNNGNIYLSGFCSENAAFGSVYLPGYGGPDAFICRVDKNGEVLWAISGGSDSPDYAIRMSLSEQGDFLAVAGYYRNTAQFGAFMLPSFDGRDAFITRIDVSGYFDWVIASGTYSDQAGYGIDIDSEGNIYCAGYFFSETWPVGPFVLMNTAPGTSADCSLIKLKANAEVSFAKSFGGSYDDLPRPLYIDQDHVYIGGYHYGSGNYLGVAVSGNPYSRNSFLMKSDMLGNGLWVLNELCPSDNELSAISFTNDHDLIVTGGFDGILEAGNQFYPSHGSYDAYIVHVNASTGVPIAAATGGGPGLDMFYGTDVYSNSVLVTGFFEYVAQFDTTTLVSSGGRDIIIAKTEGLIFGFNEPGDQKITVYPNPCDDLVMISFPKSSGQKQIILRNTSGQVVFMADAIATEHYQVDVSSLPPGLFCIQILEEGKSLILEKLIVY